MAEPLVSILIPCHNAVAWIGESLRSALQQTWPRVEVILVDDGSTDGSYELARRWASEKCCVIRQENQGASAARNRAFLAAQGDYIQYLDADDFLATDKVEQQLRVVRPGNSGLLSFSSVLHFSDQAQRRAKSVYHRARLPHARCGDPVEFLIDLWGSHEPWMVQTGQWLTPRALIEKAGPWNEKLSLDDDGEFFSRVVLRAHQIVPASGALCFYRKFRAGQNLSASGFHSGRFRRSGLEAAQKKGSRLLSLTRDFRARQAVAQLVAGEIVECCPGFPGLMREGLDFLRKNQLAMIIPPQRSPVFSSMVGLLGWRGTRWLQWHYRKVKTYGAAVCAALGSAL